MEQSSSGAASQREKRKRRRKQIKKEFERLQKGLLSCVDPQQQGAFPGTQARKVRLSFPALSSHTGFSNLVTSKRKIRNLLTWKDGEKQNLLYFQNRKGFFVCLGVLLLMCCVWFFFFLNKHKCNVCSLSVLQQHRRTRNRVNTFQEEMIHDAVLRSLYSQSGQLSTLLLPEGDFT